jgi:hypothetical protein
MGILGPGVVTAGAPHRIRILGPRCLGIALAILAMWSAPAAAAPIDRASAHVALRALDRYLRATLASLPAAKRSDQAYVRSISAGCRNALAPLNSKPASALNKAAARAFIDETVFDLVDRANLPLRGPLARMSGTLSGLRWSSPRIGAIVNAFPAAERALFAVAPSDLCADARAFAANPRAEPAGTRQWVATFTRASRRANRAGAGLGVVLGSFHGRRDVGVLRDLGRQARRLGLADKKLEVAQEGSLLRALGLRA